MVRRVEARGHLRKAHNVFQVCGRVLRYAVATGRAEREVSADLRGALPPVKTKHFAAITDPKEVGPLLRQLDGYTGTLPVRCALRLAPLVFVRLGELVAAEWAGIHLEGAEWRYTVTKNDDARVPGHGAHDSGRGAGLPARLHRAPVGPRRQGSHPNGRAYNRTAFLPERRVMMQAWADYLDGLRAGTIEPGAVVEREANAAFGI